MDALSQTLGVVRLVGYGIDPLASGGQLLQLNFDVVGTTGQQTLLTLSTAQINEGQPQVQSSNGQALVGAQVYLPFITR